MARSADRLGGGLVASVGKMPTEQTGAWTWTSSELEFGSPARTRARAGGRAAPALWAAAAGAPGARDQLCPRSVRAAPRAASDLQTAWKTSFRVLAMALTWGAVYPTLLPRSAPLAAPSEGSHPHLDGLRSVLLFRRPVGLGRQGNATQSAARAGRPRPWGGGSSPVGGTAGSVLALRVPSVPSPAASAPALLPGS